MTILIDGDVVVYQAALKAEEAIHWGSDLWTLHSDFAQAAQLFDCEIVELINKLRIDHVIVAMSAEHTFRYDLLPTYKWNRRHKRKPICWNPLRQYIRDHYQHVEYPRLEGDDVLGILATNSDETPVIVTIDKDLKGIPGRHYNPDKPELGIVEISKKDADNWHLIQTMAGDPTDGYAGIPGIGIKRAEKWLETHGFTWEAVVMAYEKANLTEADALLMARMAKILDKTCWGLSKEVLLWAPNNEPQPYLSQYLKEVAHV